MKKLRKARLIITWVCGRNCELCCNKYPKIMANRKIITTLNDLADYDEVMLTGGDPLLMEKEDLLKIVQQLRELNVKRIYLYTTWWNNNALAILPFIDGVHFSLHPDAGEHELNLLHQVEETAKKYPNKSFRLFVDAKLKMPKIKNSAWSRVEQKEFMTEKQLLQKQPRGLPQDEDLCVYLPTAKDPNPPETRRNPKS